MKSEPDVFSIDDLARDRKTLWEGVRNYQARNFMWREMKLGDSVLFYHSNAEPPGVVGVAVVSGLAIADPSQFDSKSEYFDPKASLQKPVWYCCEISFVRKLKRLIPLEDLRKDKKLKDLLVVKKGQRLSVQPVVPAHFDRILELEKK